MLSNTFLADYPQIRKALYSVVALWGLAVGVLNILGIDQLGPVPVPKIDEIVAFVVAYFGLTARANVPDDRPHWSGNAEEVN